MQCNPEISRKLKFISVLDHLSKSIGGPVLGMMSPGAGTGSQAGVEGPQLNSKLNIVTPQTHTQAVTQITQHVHHIISYHHLAQTLRRVGCQAPQFELSDKVISVV